MSQPGHDSFEPYPGARPEHGRPQEYPQLPAYGVGQEYGTAQEYGSNAYGMDPYHPSYGGHTAYGVPAQPHPQAVTALVLGLVGVAMMPPVGIAGMVLGGRARRQIDERPHAYTNRGIATAGYVLGIISLVFTALWALVLVALVVTVAVG